MQLLNHPPSRWVTCTILGVTLSAGLTGCQRAIRGESEDERIRQLASSWPPYRTPYVPDSAIEAGQNVADQLRSINRPGTNPPQIDKSINVVKPFYEWDLQETAIDSLGRIGAAAVPHLRMLLQGENPEQRRQAADMLARIGPAAKDSIPDLIASLNDDSPAVRKTAARALGQMGPEAAEAVDALFRIIQQEQQRVAPPAELRY